MKKMVASTLKASMPRKNSSVLTRMTTMRSSARP
jgi:hypothetical protein